MRRLIVAVTAAALTFTLTACDVTPGGRCDQAGSKATNKNGYTYTCQEVTRQDGKKANVWVQDAPLTPDRP